METSEAFIKSVSDNISEMGSSTANLLLKYFTNQKFNKVKARQNDDDVHLYCFFFFFFLYKRAFIKPHGQFVQSPFRIQNLIGLFQPY